MGILNVATYVTVNGQYVNVLEMNQYQNKIRFLQLTGTSGTLTSQQINLLRSDNTNYIIVDNELYNCNDLQDDNGYLVYTHTGADTSNNVNIKTLSITLTNNSWSIQTTPVQPKIPVANTNEAVQFAEDERQKSKNLFDLNTMVIYNQGASINKTAGSDITFYYSTTTAVVKIPVLPNKTYYLSSNNIQFYIGETQSNGTTQTGNPDNNLDWSTNTIITTTDNTYFIVAVVRYIGADIAITKDIFQNSNTQLEYGNKQTSYQPYHGQITHNGDAPVVFAESERQKSKNLLDNSTLKTGAYLYVNGSYENLSEYITFEPISVTPNSTITVSCPNFVSKGASGFVFFKDGVYVSALDNNVLTATVPANANQVIYNFNMAELTLDKAQNAQLEYGSVATSYQPYNGAIVHEKEIEITTGFATLNTNFITSGEVSWVKQGKLVVVSFSDIKFKSPVAHNNLYFSGLPKKAIKPQTFLLHQQNAHAGSSIRCMMQKDSTQIVNWYEDTELDTNAQYYGQFTYMTE